MYHLILVDDEPLFRSKFAKSIHWEDCGFTLDACLADGKDAIAYLAEHPVDVVLSDIKMTFVSGVELAKYISAHYPQIKIVLNSGYSEFEYAQQAIEYGVYKYLLKPNKRADVETCLKELKTLLDHTSLQVDEEMHHLLKRQALFDIYNSLLTDYDRIQARLKKIDFPLDMRHTPLTYFVIEIESFEQVSSDWKYGKDELYSALEKIYQDVMKSVCTNYPINYNQEKIEMISVLEEADCTFKHFDELLETAANQCRELLRTAVRATHLYRYHSLMDMAANSLFIQKDADFTIQELNRLKGLFIHYYNENDFASAENIAGHMLDVIKGSSCTVIKDELLSVFQLVFNATRTLGTDFANEMKNADDEEIRKLCADQFQQLFANIGKTKSNYKATIISKAKEYINQHYQEDISLENVADYVFLNKIYFCRFFKQTTGENFNDYLTLTRMNKAMEALKDPSIKIYEICELVGYKTPRYFYKLFKNHTGCTPSEYRAKVLGMRQEE